MRTRTVVWMAGAVFAVVILAVALSAGGRHRITGEYDLYIGGVRTETTVSVEPKRRDYVFTMKGNGGMQASFAAPRSRNDQYVLEGRFDGNVVSRYELRVVGNSLVGSALVLPFAPVDVELRKVK